MHIPVLLEETVAALAPRPGCVYVDGTLGRAGHAAAVMRLAGPGGRLLGVDRDGEALGRAAEALRGVPGTHVLAHGGHGDLARLARENGFGGGVDAILLDLGVSSDQLDTPGRGFSFRADGPLDMRMDAAAGETAAELLARLEVGELARLFRDLGEERQAARIARAIDRERRREPIVRTARLAEIVARAVGGAHTPGRHPATRVFQALRMAVNDEVGQLRRALEDGLGLLRPGGRMAVITFESLTDRVVKACFREHCGREEALPQGGSVWRGAEPRTEWVFRRVVTARPEELGRNPRARSAKLRAVRRMETAEVGDDGKA